MIQANMSGDTETFKNMRNTLIKSIAVVGGIFLALKGGLLALPGIISGVYWYYCYWWCDIGIFS